MGCIRRWVQLPVPRQKDKHSMQTKKDYSIGVVPLFKNPEGVIYICLVHHATGHWAFPKGHKDNDEQEWETALRELREETGIKDIELGDKTFDEFYSFEVGGVKYDKTVKYFFGYTKDTSFLIPDEFKEEISEVAWFPYEEALERSTFQETRDTLNSVLGYIKS